MKKILLVYFITDLHLRCRLYLTGSSYEENRFENKNKKIQNEQVAFRFEF